MKQELENKHAGYSLNDLSFNKCTLRKIVLLPILFLLACSTASMNGLQGLSMAYSKAGEGPVTVIFESGLGNGMSSWTSVIKPISSFATTFAYDRPGYGRSRKVAGSSRTGLDSVEQLRALLAQAGVHTPYVLVGHSLGGLYMQLFARLYPDEVAGLVLVDSTSAGWRSQPDPVGLPRVIRREYDGIVETVEQVLGAPPFPEIPLFVLTAGTTEGGSRIAYLHRENQRRLAELSPHSIHVISSRSGHFVQNDDPEAVIEAVRYVVERVEDDSGH